jgi:hypothetical protein
LACPGYTKAATPITGQPCRSASSTPPTCIWTRPLRSLALRNAELAELVGDASREALVSRSSISASRSSVDALVIAGDLYDGDQTSMKTARFLASQLERLHGAGVRVLHHPRQPRRPVENRP